MQIIGMSATLPNLDLVARWLGAAAFRTEYRPVRTNCCARTLLSECAVLVDTSS